LSTGKHTLTAITRHDSKNTFPSGVIVKRIDYHHPATTIEALRGQEVLIITLSGAVAPDTEEKLIRAAGEAGVPWILPSDFTPDTTHEPLVKDVAVFEARVKIRHLIEQVGKSAYISFITGFWYEYCLAMPQAFGFDFANKEVTLFDEGLTKVSLSTWPQIGKAVAALLSLPMSSKEGACLEQFRNKAVVIDSFTVSQRDIFASVLRVTETMEDQWTIKKEAAKERIATGLAEVEAGNRGGMAKAFFTKVFIPGMGGDFEHEKGTVNAILGLEKGDLDTATERAIRRSEGK
jgi:hypothetical protein